jgi:hypothetical protein
VQQQMSVEELHESWLGTDLEQQRQLLHEALLLLESTHPDVPRSVLRCLLSVLLENRENLAGQWLAGVTYFNRDDLQFLGEAEPLGREMHGTVIQFLGRLAFSVGRPFVLVLDQLDLLSTVQQLDEIQRLLFALIDQSENWVVLIGLVGERFKFWEENISQALRGRIGVPDLVDLENFKLPTIEITAIQPADQHLLIQRRLESPSLQKQRALDQIMSASYPFAEKDMGLLMNGKAVYPRHLLAACSERYSQICLEGETLIAVPLLEKVEALLEEAIDQSSTQAELMNPVELGERVRDLIQLLAPEPVNVTLGDLAQQQKDFDGSDFYITSRANTMRLVSSDATGKTFAVLMQKLIAEPEATLLIRNSAARIPTRGEATEPLQTFRSMQHFHPVTKAEAVVLLSLGSVLAALREGNYEHLVTQPPATQENVQLVLRSSERLRQLRVWQVVQKALSGEKLQAKPPKIKTRSDKPANSVVSVQVQSSGSSRPAFMEPLLTTPVVRADRATEPVPPPLPSKPLSNAGKPSAALMNEVKRLLVAERWLELHALQQCLERHGHECEMTQLRDVLLSQLFSAQVMLCPAELLHRDMTQIAIWREDLFFS